MFSNRQLSITVYRNNCSYTYLERHAASVNGPVIDDPMWGGYLIYRSSLTVGYCSSTCSNCVVYRSAMMTHRPCTRLLTACVVDVVVEGVDVDAPRP